MFDFSFQIILSITIIAVQAVPVPKEQDVYQYTAYPRRHARDLTYEKLAKQSSVKDDFDLDQAEADPRKIDKSEGLRYKRSPPLVEMDSELLAKHISGSDNFDLGEEEDYARVNSKGYYGRNKRSPVAPLVELTSESLAKHTSGSDYSDLVEEEGSPRVNGKKDNGYRHKRSEAWDLQEEDVYGEPRRAYPYYGYAKISPK